MKAHAMNRRYLLLSFLLGACSLAPDYQRPAMETPAAYKETGDWQTAAQSFAPPEQWWQVFGDPVLNDLQEQLVIDNQNIKLAEAQYRAARAAVDSARAGFFPTLGVNAAASRGARDGGSPANLYTLSAQAGWEVDLWGKVRSGADSATAQAEAAEAQVGAAQLSAQALLAQTYFQLRAAEAQAALYARNVAAYERFLQLTQNRRDTGVASSLDVAQAETQLNSARSQYSEAKLQRAQYEHALATLLGKPPAALTLPAADRLAEVPPAPTLLPSTTLERRYDIYAAERQVAAANARIGVARAAWFPVLNLSASGGYSNNAIANLISLPNRFWSIGPALAATLFDGGARSAAIEQAYAGVDQAAATYRQTVLTAFQEVEDNLAAARLLAEEADSQNAALAAARKAREIAENQYRAGIIAALNVITAQTSELSAENATLSLWSRRMTAAVQLLKNTGGRPLADEAAQ
ncbi:MAG: efflux transporter outer membrane subunit [Zoogloeaceae bacterium]|jgi:NodT family efflux transporter outer membrane factor (OMF) lipoprotein|nr:efflux transporter outer membrane subunit [Zoogloeaceae bacterium]